MYGAIVVEPKTPLPHADKHYVLVANAGTLDRDGLTQPAQFDMAEAHAQERPHRMTFNGYAGQYVNHLTPGRAWRDRPVLGGGGADRAPSTDFHIVGTIPDRAQIDADLTQHLNNVQTKMVPAGGGGVFDVDNVGEPLLYLRRPSAIRGCRPGPGRIALRLSPCRRHDEPLEERGDHLRRGGHRRDLLCELQRRRRAAWGSARSAVTADATPSAVRALHQDFRHAERRAGPRVFDRSAPCRQEEAGPPWASAPERGRGLW